MLLSISKLITEEQAKDYLNSLEDFNNTLEMQKEFSIDLKLSKDKDGKYQPFLIEGDWMGCVEREKDGQKYVIHYIQVMRKVDGNRVPVMVSMYGFQSMHTQLKKLGVKECMPISFRYSGKLPVPNSKDRTFHSCYIKKLDESALSNEAQENPMSDIEATEQVYKDLNKASDDLPF